MIVRLNMLLNSHALALLRISLGIVYVWFGALKYFPNTSTADQLAKETIAVITFGLIPGAVSIVMLALWETVLGTLLIVGVWRRAVYYLLLVHLACTFVPLFAFVELSFSRPPVVFTLVGQYIVKNIVFIAAALVLNIRQQATPEEAG